MHELSIAGDIIEIIGQSIPEAERHLIRAVKVRIGRFGNVMPDSLKFCFEALINDTELRDAELITEEIPLTIKCNSCSLISEIDEFLFICPGCGSPDINILTGNELTVTEIELSDYLG